MQPHTPKVFFVLNREIFIQALSIFEDFSFEAFRGIRYINDDTSIITKYE